jgi:NAD-dependent deacetylase
MWQWGHALYPRLRDAVPNPGHRALAELERAGQLRRVITQNIDELHQRVGSQQVIELHGSAMRVGCLSCGQDDDRDSVHARIEAGDIDPRCTACGGLLKTQAMPERETTMAFAWAQTCDVLLVVGSSVVVYPAAELYTVTWAGSQLPSALWGEGGRQLAPFCPYVPRLRSLFFHDVTFPR